MNPPEESQLTTGRNSPWSRGKFVIHPLVNVAVEYLESAFNWGKENYPQASVQHHAAFANSVSYLMTGGSGGYGGTSLREYLVSWSLSGPNGTNEGVIQYPDGSLSRPGNWAYDDAIAFCAPLCFEPVDKYRDRLLAIAQNEHCFDDDPQDLEDLEISGNS